MKSFDKQKKELRMTYKRLKVGLVKWDDLDVKTQNLLRKYYGVEL